MSVMINLLPDIRLQKIRDANRRRMATLSSISIIIGSLAILFLLFVFDKAQDLQITMKTNSIASKYSEFKSKPNLMSILTMQQQIENLPVLYKNRRNSATIIRELSQVTPTTVSINNYELGADNMVTMTGTARSYQAVTQLVKALKETSKILENSESRAVNVTINYTKPDLGATSLAANNQVLFSVSAQLEAGGGNGN